jgi:tetratricopeptide (TPR) repeat protein
VEYAAALTARPSDRQVQFESHVNRAQHAVETGAWGAAAAEFARAIALQPDLACLWRWRTVAQLAAGETEAYRQTCAAMSKHFEATGNPRTASDVIEACVLRQDSLADMTRLLPLVQVASSSRYPGTFVDGAALYRAGRYEDAIRHFEEEAKAIRPRAWSWAFLAMAHSRLGHAEAARRCLADAVAWMAEANRQEFGELTGTRPAWGGWPEPVVSALLVREAETLLQRAEHQPGG